MNIGAFYNSIIEIAIAVYFIYLSKKQKDKLGNKAKWFFYGGIALLIYGILSFFI